MLKSISILKFFSRDHEQSKALEEQLAALQSRLKAVSEETSETELKELQQQMDCVREKAKSLRTVQLKTMAIAAFKRLPHIKVDDEEMTNYQTFEQRKATILECSDLTKEQFDLLATPDFHQLYSDICEYILTPADIAQGSQLDSDQFNFDLLHPFTNEVQDEIKHIRFNVPKTIHSEELSKLTDNEEREDFMFRVVTGLEKRDFEFLSTNDYLALKPQVGAFF